MNLFKKAAAMTDIHWGLKHNSRVHNDDCEDFVNWFIKTAKEAGCETCFFLGDWHNNRATVNVSTLNYTVSNLKRLSDAFDNVYFLAGNHDLFYREKREIHSIPFADHLPNIHMINEPTEIGGVGLIPWLVEEEWKQIKDMEIKYMFGHFELPGFMLNAMVRMPDTGELHASQLTKPDYIFSGHFHKRQISGKVHYIGNPFGHNYSDAGDFDRGMMMLEWGEKPEYVNWEDGPKYVTAELSEILEDPEEFLCPKMHVKANINVDITYEEATFLKETFVSGYDIRELKFIYSKDDEYKNDTEAEISFETVDQIVIDSLTNIDSSNFDKAKLIDIYNGL